MLSCYKEFRDLAFLAELYKKVTCFINAFDQMRLYFKASNDTHNLLIILYEIVDELNPDQIFAFKQPPVVTIIEEILNNARLHHAKLLSSDPRNDSSSRYVDDGKISRLSGFSESKKSDTKFLRVFKPSMFGPEESHPSLKLNHLYSKNSSMDRRDDLLSEKSLKVIVDGQAFSENSLKEVDQSRKIFIKFIEEQSQRNEVKGYDIRNHNLVKSITSSFILTDPHKMNRPGIEAQPRIETSTTISRVDKIPAVYKITDINEVEIRIKKLRLGGQGRLTSCESCLNRSSMNEEGIQKFRHKNDKPFDQTLVVNRSGSPRMQTQVFNPLEKMAKGVDHLENAKTRCNVDRGKHLTEGSNRLSSGYDFITPKGNSKSIREELSEKYSD